jgi:hypothetical protein
MKNVLFKIPSKDSEELFLSIISDKFKIDISLINILKKYFKDDVYLIFTLFAGKSINFPTIDNLDEIGKMIAICSEMKKMLEYGVKFENVIQILSDKFQLSTNKIFSFYNELLYRNKIFESITKKEYGSYD